MRISDWSSDVCSSDLRPGDPADDVGDGLDRDDAEEARIAVRQAAAEDDQGNIGRQHDDGAPEGFPEALARGVDRKSVVEGKRGSVGVNLGGGRISKKKQKKR